MLYNPVKPMEGITLGCDPELFIVDPNGKYVSAEGLIPGTKSEPFAVEKGAVQVDGMAAEFNIDPAKSFEEFDGNIMTVINQLKSMLPTGYRLRTDPAVEFDEDVWDSSPDTAKELGCTPDFNAWTGEVNPPPILPDNPRLRCAGGHVHIGWTQGAALTDLQHIANCRDLSKQLDWYLGGWSLKTDTDPRRRLLYGKAGAIRYKDYGVEYRVLSNFWLRSKGRRQGVWDRVNQAIWDMSTNFMPDKAVEFGDFNNILIESINQSQRSAVLERRFRFPIYTTDASYQHMG